MILAVGGMFKTNKQTNISSGLTDLVQSLASPDFKLCPRPHMTLAVGGMLNTNKPLGVKLT